MNETLNSQNAPEASIRISRASAVFLLACTVLWLYWPAFMAMADKWDRKPEYSHGWMIPLFAVFLLWQRRRMLTDTEVPLSRIGGGLLAAGVVTWICPWMFAASGSLGLILGYAGIVMTLAGFSVLVSTWLEDVPLRPAWWGLAVIMGAVAMRLYSADVYLEWCDFLSLIPFIIGLVWLTGGRQVLAWSWVAIVFLFFMIPLPFSMEVALRDPLRRAGTLASTYVMQTIGLPAFAEGNVVTVNDVGIDVVEACSGLRMMMVFFALSAGLAVVLDRPLWQRALLLASALPIALITNILRITSTGLLHVWGYHELAENVFHDVAGLAMPIIAIGLLQLEMWYLDRLFIVDKKFPMQFGIGAIKPAEPSGT